VDSLELGSVDTRFVGGVKRRVNDQERRRGIGGKGRGDTGRTRDSPLKKKTFRVRNSGRGRLKRGMRNHGRIVERMNQPASGHERFETDSLQKREQKKKKRQESLKVG